MFGSRRVYKRMQLGQNENVQQLGDTPPRVLEELEWNSWNNSWYMLVSAKKLVGAGRYDDFKTNHQIKEKWKKQLQERMGITGQSCRNSDWD